MKVKDEFDLSVLEKYGFSKVDKEAEERDDNYEVAVYDYALDMGHSRRGQCYYLLVSERSREINVYASNPDGGGCSIPLDDVLIKMITDGIVKPN